MNPIQLDLMSDAIPRNVWNTLGSMLAQNNAKDFDPIGIVNATPQRSRASKLNLNILDREESSEGPANTTDTPNTDLSSLISTQQLEDITGPISGLTAMLSGNTHAAEIISSLGLMEGTSAIAGANALGEGALNVAAAQSLAQQGAVGTGTAAGAGGGLASLGTAVPVAAFLAYGAYILSMRNSNGPPNLSATDILRASEGETVHYEGGEGVPSQDVTMTENGLVLDPGSGQYIDTTNSTLMNEIRKNAYAEQWNTHKNWYSDKGMSEEIIQSGVDPANIDVANMGSEEIIALAGSNYEDWFSRLSSEENLKYDWSSGKPRTSGGKFGGLG